MFYFSLLGSWFLIHFWHCGKPGATCWWRVSRKSQTETWRFFKGKCDLWEEVHVITDDLIWLGFCPPPAYLLFLNVSPQELVLNHPAGQSEELFSFLQPPESLLESEEPLMEVWRLVRSVVSFFAPGETEEEVRMCNSFKDAVLWLIYFFVHTVQSLKVCFTV